MLLIFIFFSEEIWQVLFVLFMCGFILDISGQMLAVSRPQLVYFDWVAKWNTLYVVNGQVELGSQLPDFMREMS